MPKKIAICHYRVGGTDGVSLEIEKRKQILEKYGCVVKLIAGHRSKGADFTVRELEWDDGSIPIIKENGFLYFNRNDLDEGELKRKIKKISNTIEKRLSEIQDKEHFDHVLTHNIFSFGGHIAAAKAFTNWIRAYKIPCLATHHDFYWERKESAQPRSDYLRNYMKKYMPPQNKYIEHVVINSLTRRELEKRRSIKSSVLPDVFDFEQKKWEKDKFNKDFFQQFDIKKRDLVVLQATRVIPRKGIEIAIDYARELQNNIKKLRGKIIYNGKELSSHSNVVLIIAGYAEDEKRDYLFKLKSKAFDDRVRAKFVSGYVKANRSYHQGIKTYSLWDAYAYADVVTFPSIWEGWGNQFIEAVFANKPIVLFKYPAYRKDIELEGYMTISLGDKFDVNKENNLYSVPQKYLDRAVRKTIRWMTNKTTCEKLERNFRIGKKYHDYKVLENFLIKKLDLEPHEYLAKKS